MRGLGCAHKETLSPGEMAMEAHRTTTGNRQHRGQGLGVERAGATDRNQGPRCMAHRTVECSSPQHCARQSLLSGSGGR